MSPSATEAESVPSTGAVSSTGVMEKLKVELEGVEESSLPSSTLTWKEADVVSDPSCWKETSPLAS